MRRQSYLKVEGQCSADGHCLGHQQGDQKGDQQGDQAEYVKYNHERCRRVSPATQDLNTPPPPPHNDSLALPLLTVSVLIN